MVVSASRPVTQAESAMSSATDRVLVPDAGDVRGRAIAGRSDQRLGVAAEQIVKPGLRFGFALAVHDDGDLVDGGVETVREAQAAGEVGSKEEALELVRTKLNAGDARA